MLIYMGLVKKFINGRMKLVIVPDYPEPSKNYVGSTMVQPTVEVKQEVQCQPVERNSDKKIKNRAYYENNKERYYSCPVECECGITVTKVHLNRHKQSTKHELLMELNYIHSEKSI